jgi:hypothetical protein
VLARTGAPSFAAAALPVAGASSAEAFRAWLAAAAAVPGDRLVLLGDPRALAAELATARIAARVEIEVALHGAAPAAMVR